MAAKGSHAWGRIPRKDREGGAAAVELAFVLPILLLLVMGIIEFGHAYNTQISLTNAAREGVRVMAITQDSDDATEAALKAASSIPGVTAASITVPDDCTGGTQVTVTIHYELDTITGFAGPFDLSGKGVMLCGG